MSSHGLITSTVTVSVGAALIARAGIVQDDRGRWVVPEEAQVLTGHAWTWAMDEAFTWALVIIASVDEPELLVWS